MLADQANNDNKNASQYLKLKKDANDVMAAFSKGKIDDIGKIIGVSWERKKSLSIMISNKRIDQMVSTLYAYGCLGCKLLGAGDGGFILAFKKHEQQPISSDLLSKPIFLSPDTQGSILFATT